MTRVNELKNPNFLLLIRKMNRSRQLAVIIVSIIVADVIIVWLMNKIVQEEVDLDVNLSNRTMIVFMIISKHTNYEKRMAIRNTWKSNVNKLENCTSLFFLAEDPEATDPSKINEEMTTFNDIVLLNTTESYQALNYKIIHALTWIIDNIKDYDMVVKIDDDVWLNVDYFYPAALDLMKKQEKELFIWGLIHMGAWVTLTGKNADVEYGELIDTYPPYPNGPFYALHGEVARYIVTMHKQGWLKLFFNEDTNMGIWLWARRITTIHDTRMPLMGVRCTAATKQNYGFMSIKIELMHKYEKNWKLCRSPCGC